VIGLFTPAQVRAMDERALAVPGAVPDALMERAAGHLARGVVRLAGRSAGLRVAVLSGQGNNGADGLAAARRLIGLGAAPVVVLVAGAETVGAGAHPTATAGSHPTATPGSHPTATPGSHPTATPTSRELARYRAVGGRLADSVDAALDGAEVAVDCLLGTGATGEPRPPYRAAIEALAARPGLPVVACDVPTGVDADTGRVPGLAVRARLTVTMGVRKRGLALWPARGYVGEEVLGEVGALQPGDQPVAHVLEAPDAAALLPVPAADAHKRTRGVVVVLAGSPGMGGAAVMVARGAMAAGAGYVTVATGDPGIVTATVPEAVTLRVDPRDGDAAFDAVAGLLGRADALAVGPGLGHDDPTVHLVRRLVREVEVPLVLDADGINAFRDDGDALADHRTPLLTLTPHAAEFGRLVGRSGHGAGQGGAPAPPGGGDPIWAQRVTLVPQCAAAWRAVVVAKGPGSMIAAPDGRVWVNPTGSAALATAGTGDVLTGITAALVAQRPEPASVAAAVYLHGLAGEVAEERSHPRSVTALDVAAAVPAALRRIDAHGEAP